jgi:hypothetical protein
VVLMNTGLPSAPPPVGVLAAQLPSAGGPDTCSTDSDGGPASRPLRTPLRCSTDAAAAALLPGSLPPERTDAADALPSEWPGRGRRRPPSPPPPPPCEPPGEEPASRPAPPLLLGCEPPPPLPRPACAAAAACSSFAADRPPTCGARGSSDARRRGCERWRWGSAGAARSLSGAGKGWGRAAGAGVGGRLRVVAARRAPG